MATVSHMVICGWLDTVFVVLAQDGGAGLINFLVPVALVMALAYFMFVLPENRRRAELQKQLENIKKHDKVITSGGIYGVVVNAAKGSERITIRVDESNNTTLQVLRGAIVRVVSEESTEGGSSESS